ncbi:MAG: DegT/DnrJ/EryC1/StrS family aminotransferase [Nitrospinaceae bacterium]|jgi:perosamine synthetase|nr:DegT/DnrJ/EryC1/StrS family aminotransferase [Nitrospina sp.]MBT5869489.1 DegT/DnrJ/EryC1/StrS family aminotransferase [Nitrospinaceae bacterium]MBT6345166.1 DegT/DnrJ/EryC1/StrS family aminotransferase [Nitrospina sp.]
MNKTKIPVNEPYLGQREKELVNECLESGWISSAGKYIEKFENQFAEYCECAEGVTTTSGTTAIHLALKSLGVGPGDEVLVPAFTMVGSVYPIVQCGASPVFVDSEPDTGNMDIQDLESKITASTKVILIVHIYGHPADMDPICDLARSRNLKILEDAAEAHGALYKGRKAGSLGDVGCFSFYANKIITTGEGGMIVSNDKDLIKKARQLKDLAHGKIRFTHELPEAFNYRMTNIQAAIGLGQLERIEETVKKKIANAEQYSNLLKGVSCLKLPVCRPWARNVYWMYGVQLLDNDRFARDELMTALKNEGVDTRSFFYPLNTQKAFQGYGKQDCPKAEILGKQGFYLPSGQTLKPNQIQRVAEILVELLQA